MGEHPVLNVSVPASSSESSRDALCSSDYLFGPAIQGCRQSFDFTLLFEQSILSVLPVAIFLLLVPLRLFYLQRGAIKTVPNPIRIGKLAVTVALALCQLALLILWIQDTLLRTMVSVPSAALNFVAAVEIVALSYTEHNRSIKPSSLLSVYLLITLVLDSAQARTLYLKDGNPAIFSLFTATIGIKLILLLLESHNKRPYLRSTYHHVGVEITSGIINRTFFWWLNGLFIRGFRHLITYQELYELDVGLAAEALGADMQKAWDVRSTPEDRYVLARTILRALLSPLLIAVFPRLCLIGFNFAQPFLITRTLNLLSEPINETSQNEGYGLIGATGLIYIGIALTTLHYNHNMYRFITKFRGATVALIYSQTLLLQDGVYDESAALTLMSTDVDNISNALVLLNECWAQALEVAIGIYLLARQIGWVCIMPIIIVAFSTVGASQVTKQIGSRQKLWVAAVQRRIAITSSMLSEMKSIKMMGLSEIMTSIVQSQRVRETKHMAGFRWMIVWKNITANLSYAWAPACTFAVYAIQARLKNSDSIGTTQAFTSLSLITLVTSPAAKLLASIPSVASSLGCFDRIQKFLLAPPREDQRFSSENGWGSSKIDVQPSSNSEMELVQVAVDKPAGSAGVALQVVNATIRPGKDAEIALRDINITIKKGSVAMIVGPVGSGKTTLLRAILGEITCESGSIWIMDATVSYCAQKPWLPNGTIQQAVCGPTESLVTDEEWYRCVLRSCVLDFDLSDLIDEDQTIIGSRGITLSGGQKQRVALARAVYSRHDILILDDVLSALDARTKNIVVEQLLGRAGLLRKLGATVILVTHTTQYLSLADNIVVLSENGEVVQQGTFRQSTHWGFSDSTFSSVEDSPNDLKEVQLQDKQKREERFTIANQIDDLTRQTGDFATYKYYWDIIGWPKSLIFISFVVVNVFCASFSQIWLKWWTDINGGQIGLYISIYFLLALFNSVGMGGYIWAILVYIAPSTARIAHFKLLGTVMRAPQSLFTSTDIGSILNRFSQDMTLIEGSLPTGVLLVVSNLFSSIAEAALISTGSSYMAITAPILILAIYILQNVYLKTSRQLRFLDLEAKSPMFSHFLETLNGLSTIRAFGWQRASNDTNIKRLNASQRPYYLLYCIQRWLALVLDLIVAALAVIVVALAVSLRGSTSPGLLGVSLNNVLSFNNSLSSVVNGWTMFETSLGAIARLRSFEKGTKPEAQEDENKEPPVGWPEEGAIELLDVTASYNPTAAALQNVNIKILPGQKIGICGRTGGGKSSLISTILRLLDLDSGTILIDGLDLSTLPRETIRSRLITIPQEPFLLTGSVRLNADPSNTISDSNLISALTKVRLWDTLQERGGLDADLHVNSLSHGQLQLFALGRAIVEKSRGRILILDEATSNVDAETDEIIQSVIRKEFKGYTILSVAHRLDTILDADMIAVMELGRLVEFENPQALLKKDSAFKKLYRSGGLMQ